MTDLTIDLVVEIPPGIGPEHDARVTDRVSISIVRAIRVPVDAEDGSVARRARQTAAVDGLAAAHAAALAALDGLDGGSR